MLRLITALFCEAVLNEMCEGLERLNNTKAKLGAF